MYTLIIIKNKKIFNIDNIDVNEILVSKKETYGKYNSFKYFIGYNDNDVIRPLYLFISQTTGYINKFDKNKITMSIMIKDIQLLKNWVSIIILDSIIYAYEKYYPKVFLEECKYVKENIKTKNYIDMKLESESDIDSDSENDIHNDIDVDNEE